MIDVPRSQPRTKLTQPQRKALITTLQLQGLNQSDIARQLGCSRKTIVRDIAELRPSEKAQLDRAKSLIDEITCKLPTEKRAGKYVELATRAKNEAVSLAALQRIDDLEGIVTEKERIRAKAHQAPEPQPMFVLPAGAHVNVTVNQSINKVAPAELEQPSINIDTK